MIDPGAPPTTKDSAADGDALKVSATAKEVMAISCLIGDLVG